jgi:hypothetical protein
LYIIAKFNDEVRALLVKRWHELETGLRKTGIKLYPHEREMFRFVKTHLVMGDNTSVAELLKELELTPEQAKRVFIINHKL